MRNLIILCVLCVFSCSKDSVKMEEKLFTARVAYTSNTDCGNWMLVDIDLDKGIQEYVKPINLPSKYNISSGKAIPVKIQFKYLKDSFKCQVFGSVVGSRDYTYRRIELTKIEED